MSEDFLLIPISLVACGWENPIARRQENPCSMKEKFLLHKIFFLAARNFVSCCAESFSSLRENSFLAAENGFSCCAKSYFL